MARTINNIQSGIIAALVSLAAAAGLTIIPAEWSDYDYRQLLTYVMAQATASLEQLFDAFKIDVEAQVAVAAPQTGPWYQNIMLNLFEYDATAVPIVQLDTTTDFAPYYPDPNPAYRIIKYCSATSAALGTNAVKIAKQVSGAPAALSSPELDAAQSFLNTIAGPGIVNNAVSLNADNLFMQMDVYYRGLYAAVIQTDVIAAINAYLATIPFNGVVILTDLLEAIKAVPGVTDMVWNNVQARADLTAFGAGTNLVSLNTVVQKQWSTVAGYIIPETTSGFTLTDARVSDPSINNLNLIAE